MPVDAIVVALDAAKIFDVFLAILKADKIPKPFSTEIDSPLVCFCDWVYR